MKDAIKTIEAILDKQNIVFLSSVNENGYPNTKAMLSPRKRDGIMVFYFHTNTSSVRVRQYQQNSKACLYFCDKRFFKGVLLIGTVEVLEDDAHKEMLWQEGDTMYYPGGKTDSLRHDAVTTERHKIPKYPMPLRLRRFYINLRTL